MSKLFPKNIVLLPSNEVADKRQADSTEQSMRGDELRELLDIFTQPLNVEQRRSLALVRNDVWEVILLSELRYRALKARTASSGGNVPRSSLISSLQSIMLECLSDAAITCALGMTVADELQWEFAERYAGHNTVWHCTGDAATLIDWLLTVQTASQMDEIFVGYDDDESVFNDTPTQRTLYTVASFTCTSDTRRWDHVAAIAAWIRGFLSKSDLRQLTIVAGLSTTDRFQTVDFAGK